MLTYINYMKVILSVELIYNDTDPPTDLHFNRAQSTPDLLLVSSDISANTKRIILDDPGSGHKPVIAKITLTQQQRAPDPYIRTSWNIKKPNWGNFTDMLETNLHQERIDFSHHPDKIGKVINSIIISCAKACIPRGRVKSYKCFWIDDLETLKNQREYLRTRAEHTGKIEDAQAWRRQTAILRREITESKRKSFKNFISHIDYQEDNQKTYKYLARIQNDTPYCNKVPIYESNAVVTSDRGIANTFACTFSRAQKRGTYARKRSKLVKGEYKTLKQKSGSAKHAATEDTFDSPISECELQAAIKQLKNRKSPGEDQIHAEFLKHAGKEARTSILRWFQKNLGNRYCALALEKSNSSVRTENR